MEFLCLRRNPPLAPSLEISYHKLGRTCTSTTGEYSYVISCNHPHFAFHMMNPWVQLQKNTAIHFIGYPCLGPAAIPQNIINYDSNPIRCTFCGNRRGLFATNNHPCRSILEATKQLNNHFFNKPWMTKRFCQKMAVTIIRKTTN